MAYKKYNGDIALNLEQQVQKNKDDILRHYQIERVLADWGIRIIGQLDTWEIPTGSFEYGDAYAVGPDGGPFVFYIYTRGNPDYWFDYGAISIVGPQGPVGPAGIGERGERGSKWFVGSNPPTGDIKPNDIWLRVSNDGRTDGFVYMYQNNAWALATSIIGPQGIPGPEGKQGPQGPQGIQGPQGKDGNPSPIIDIIAELPEGSIISATYDPATVPSNSGVLMPVGGVNHLFIIINGNWTDSGSWGQGGTRVYINGEEATEFNADTKVDKITQATASNVYVYTTDFEYGVQNKVHKLGNNNSNYVAYNIPMIYGSTSGESSVGGYLLTNTPKNKYHAANKYYVDTQIIQAVQAAHKEIQHATLKWSYLGEELELIIGCGVYGPTIQNTYNGDFTAWGGNLVFYGVGGLANSGGGYADNDAIAHRLYCRMDTGEIQLQCIYDANSQSWNNPSVIATFELGGASIYDGNVHLYMIPASGLPGGLFPLNSIPNL